MDFVQHISANGSNQSLPVRLINACRCFIEPVLPESHFRGGTKICQPLCVRRKAVVFPMAPREAQCHLRHLEVSKDVFNDLVHLTTLEQLCDQEDITEAVVDLPDLAMSLLIEDGSCT